MNVSVDHWDSRLADQTLISCEVNRSHTVVWDDSATATDYITTLTETFSYNQTHTGSRVDFDVAISGNEFHILTGYPFLATGQPPRTAIRMHAAYFACEFTWTDTATIVFDETYEAIPPFDPGDLPEPIHDEIETDVEITLIAVMNDRNKVEWQFVLSIGGLGTIIDTPIFNPDEGFNSDVTVDPFTLSGDFGFTETETDNNPVSIIGMDLVSSTAELAVDVVVS